MGERASVLEIEKEQANKVVERDEHLGQVMRQAASNHLGDVVCEGESSNYELN
jgi:hypothetical protein